MNDADNRPAVVGQVERPVRPGAEARWYCLSREGMATLCTDEEDAKEVAAESFVLYPQNGPYRAVQMVDSAHVTDLLAEATRQAMRAGAQRGLTEHYQQALEAIAFHDYGRLHPAFDPQREAFKALKKAGVLGPNAKLTGPSESQGSNDERH